MTTKEKRALFIKRSSLVLGIDEASTERLLAQPRKQSVRLNTLLHSATPSCIVGLNWQEKAVPWCQNGYTVDDICAAKDSELAQNGSIIIQNAASWVPVIALDPRPNDEILDMCAAPGMKSSHIAAITDNGAILTANDNSKSRLFKMRANFSRLHVVAEDTLYDARYLSKKLTKQFDKILLDAPCSGEGLIRLDSTKDFTYWSPAQIKRLSQLQKKLIMEAWKLLKPDGTLVYSTCTIAPEENEAVIDYLLRKTEDMQLMQIDIPIKRGPILAGWGSKQYSSDLSKCIRLLPSSLAEAFFVAKLRKT